MTASSLACLLAALASLAGAGAVAPQEGPVPPASPDTPNAASRPTPPRIPPDAVPHDLHVTYANAAVEGNAVVVRLRLFKDDLGAALGREVGVTVLALTASPQVDEVFLRYLGRHLTFEVEGTLLEPAVVTRGEELLDREPVWWYALRYQAAGPVTRLRVKNTLLFDLFEDQRNVMKFVHFPDETQRTYGFARGEEVFTVDFGGG